MTEGGCAPRPGTAYTSILSRWLDADYFNYGFSGGAKGELVFAEYIAKHKNISVFVYDYDHNAPTPEHLANTHEPFFKVIREAHPDIPIVMMSRPDFDRDPKDSIERRNIIYQTYINAKKSGDNNVYFVDGMQFFGPVGRSECTIDGCHPNALGFMRMAETLYPLMSHLLRDYR
nr:SGNH/GDSL hydrolase family protein [Thermoclostridium stercorarium]